MWYDVNYFENKHCRGFVFRWNNFPAEEHRSGAGKDSIPREFRRSWDGARARNTQTKTHLPVDRMDPDAGYRTTGIGSRHGTTGNWNRLENYITPVPISCGRTTKGGSSCGIRGTVTVFEATRNGLETRTICATVLIFRPFLVLTGGTIPCLFPIYSYRWVPSRQQGIVPLVKTNRNRLSKQDTIPPFETTSNCFILQKRCSSLWLVHCCLTSCLRHQHRLEATTTGSPPLFSYNV